MSAVVPTSGLTFDGLRRANRARLPQFKNRHGAPAHSQPDGSDWSPAQWFQAFFGEVGEMAQVRRDFEHGNINRDQYRAFIAKEIADAQTYLDLFAQRAFDEIENVSLNDDAAQTLMSAVADLGAYANERKKLDRGDLTRQDFNLKRFAMLRDSEDAIGRLERGEHAFVDNPVKDAHPEGVDLGRATIEKFNEVSARVGADVSFVLDREHADYGKPGFFTGNGGYWKMP